MAKRGHTAVSTERPVVRGPRCVHHNGRGGRWPRNERWRGPSLPPKPESCGTTRAGSGSGCAIQGKEWRSLAIVPASRGLATLEVAQALVDVGWQHRGLPIGLADLRNVTLPYIDSVIDEVRSHVFGGERVLIALRSIFENPATVPIAQAADRALLCIGLGATQDSWSRGVDRANWSSALSREHHRARQGRRRFGRWRVRASLLILVTALGCAQKKMPADDAAKSPTVDLGEAPMSVAAAPTAAGSTVIAALPDDPDPSAPWTIEVADGSTLRIENHGTRVATFKYLFWGANYSWADPVVSHLKSVDGVTTFNVAVSALGLSIAGRIERSGPGELSVQYDITSSKKLDGVVGGGMEWSLNLGALTPGKPSDPMLLPDRRGFRWDVAGSDGISVSFDPPLPSAYFEQNQKSVVRCFLVGTRSSRAPGRSPCG